MKTKHKSILTFGLLISCFTLFSAFSHKGNVNEFERSFSGETGGTLKEQALEILVNKCNTCHRKQNPFMIFKMKNIENRAKKIYNMVFITKRMPKGDEVKLSREEYATLKSWLSTQNIY